MGNPGLLRDIQLSIIILALSDKFKRVVKSQIAGWWIKNSTPCQASFRAWATPNAFIEDKPKQKPEVSCTKIHWAELQLRNGLVSNVAPSFREESWVLVLSIILKIFSDPVLQLSWFLGKELSCHREFTESHFRSQGRLIVLCILIETSLLALFPLIVYTFTPMRGSPRLPAQLQLNRQDGVLVLPCCWLLLSLVFPIAVYRCEEGLWG